MVESCTAVISVITVIAVFWVRSGFGNSRRGSDGSAQGHRRHGALRAIRLPTATQVSPSVVVKLTSLECQNVFCVVVVVTE